MGLFLALPLPQIFHFIFQDLAWPVYWGRLGPNGDGALRPAPDNNWDWSYMQFNSYTSDHRWYLIMVLQARVFLQICELMHLPGWVQGLIISIPCFLPDSAYEGKEYALDVCEYNAAPTYVLYIFSWVGRNFGDGCALFWRWVHWYTVAYVWCFHYLRPCVTHVTARLPKGPTWAAAALGTSMTIGVLMAMFHYPNNVLENGTGLEWAPLELGVDLIQPSLFALGMTYLPLDMSWWGNTTLGCYAFHFYFRDKVSQMVQSIAIGLSWDATGLLLYIVILAICLVFTSILGPIGHAFLVAPNVLPGKIRAWISARRRSAASSREVR